MVVIKNENPIKTLREKINVSQRQLADALDVHHSYIANLENNLINIEKEDEEEKTKINEIFKKLAEWSGSDYKEMIGLQKKCTKESKESIKKEVIRQLKCVVEELEGTDFLTEYEDIECFFSGLAQICREEVKSPLTIFREKGGITQRNFANAIDVSQGYIARIERGELNLVGFNKGWKIIMFVANAIMTTDGDELEYCHSELTGMQEIFMIANKEKTKDKVKEAFGSIKKKDNERKDDK